MNAIIIEDETAAVSSLKAVLARNSVADIRVVAELESIEESVAWFGSHPHPDIIFMDIHLADGSAFKIFEQVEIEAPVVFTTAYDEYALQAFRVSSIDYLLKPVTTVSLERALSKLRLLYPYTANEKAADCTPNGKLRPIDHQLGALNEKLDKALADVHEVLNKEQVEQPVFVREGSRIIRLQREEILFLEGYGDYVKIHRTTGKPLLSQVSLKRFEEYLDTHSFCRVHRSYIVALAQINYIERKRIRIGQELIPISDSYLTELMNRLALLTC